MERLALIPIEVAIALTALAFALVGGWAASMVILTVFNRLKENP